MDVEYEDLDDLFEEIECIGRGGHGMVCKAKSKKSFIGLPEGTIVALKLIDITKLREEELTEIEQEVSILIRVSSYGNCNSNIVCYYGKTLVTSRNRNYFAIVMEFVEGISLSNFILDTSKMKNITKFLTNKQIANIMKQLLLTVDYIHSLQVVHRDIKPDNIIYSSKTGKLKLIDFGFSCYAVPYKIKYRCNMSPKGTPLYIAPEIWDFYLKGSRKIQYNGDIEKLKKSDIWSLGISLYELIFGTNPYEGLEFINDIAENVSSDDPVLFYEFEGDPFLVDVLAVMLDKDYRKRYSAREAYDLLISKYPD